MAFLWLAAFLPYRLQMTLGRCLGRVLAKFAVKRRDIVKANLALCLPELDDAARQALCRKHFESLGMMVFELALARWGSDNRLASLTSIHGLENLLSPLRAGHGVVLLSGHFAGQEITGRVLAPSLERVAALYRANRNPVIDNWLRRIRLRAVNKLVEKDEVRLMVRLLRDGWPIWYAPDQSYRRKHSALVGFFGEPAMTSTALTEISRIGRAKVVPYLPTRLVDGSGYRVDILPALENFPSGDGIADAQRVNDLLEAHVRVAPAQYYWVHRRFKGRPAEYTDPYRAG